MGTTTAKDSAGIADPLAMLAACHARIGHHCAALQRLVGQVAGRAPDGAAREGAAQLIHELDASIREHRADDEVDLFPALIEAMAGSDAVCLREMTAQLTDQHRELEARWRRVRAELERVAAGERASIDAEEVDAWVALCERHTGREQRELLPMAARLLSDGDLERLGRAMRQRRGRESR
jgi:hemerythrin-like domain-containing protein